jgi:hypothetical protein
MNPYQSRERSKPHENGAAWEQDDESQRGEDAMGNQHLLLVAQRSGGNGDDAILRGVR